MAPRGDVTPEPAEGFVRVPHHSVRLGIPDSAFRALVALDRWAYRGGFPTNGQLAEACGWVGPDGKPAAMKARRALLELEKAGLVKRITSTLPGWFRRDGLTVTRLTDIGQPPPKAGETPYKSVVPPSYKSVVPPPTDLEYPPYKSVAPLKNEEVPYGNEESNVTSPGRDVTVGLTTLGEEPSPPEEQPARSLSERIDALPGASRADVKTVAAWIMDDLNDHASGGFFRKVVGKVAAGTAPVARLVDALAAAMKAKGDPRFKKPGAMFADAWTSWAPRLTEAEAKTRREQETAAARQECERERLMDMPIEDLVVHVRRKFGQRLELTDGERGEKIKFAGGPGGRTVDTLTFGVLQARRQEIIDSFEDLPQSTPMTFAQMRAQAATGALPTTPVEAP